MLNSQPILEPTPNSKAGSEPVGGWLTTYLSFVRFSHSVFALPFALAAMLVAAREQRGFGESWAIRIW